MHMAVTTQGSVVPLQVKACRTEQNSGVMADFPALADLADLGDLEDFFFIPMRNSRS